MNNLIITPFQGCGNILLSMKFAEVKNFLKKESIGFTTEHWSNKGCTPEVAWNVIRTDNGINIFFAFGKIFKIYFERGFQGMLFNGIRIGMTVKEAMNYDSNLEYNDDEEYYSSPDGYWLEESLDSGKIETITIFIPQLLDENEFFTYDWCK